MDLTTPTFLKLVSILIAGVGIFYVLLRRPSNGRNWTLDQAVLPCAEMKGNKATIYNIRNFTYRSIDDYTKGYYNETFDLNALEKVYFFVEPFSRFKGVAHTLISFGFSDGKYLALSIEIRKKRGESFSAFRSGILGLFRKYEIMYVLADERDVVKLRANYRKDDVYMYPLRSTKDSMKRAFTGVLRRVNKLYEEPEFFHTITNNCATNLTTHVGEITPERIPWNITQLFPREADRDLFNRGFIDTDLPFEKIREAHRINDLAERYAEDPQFSLRIRGKE